jgi:glycosyltransferase involved in cell wall biosynthesis
MGMTLPGLRVLHVNAFASEGGAARAAFRIHRALVESGVDSSMLVMHTSQPQSGVIVSPAGARRSRRLKEACSVYLMRLQRTPANPVLHSLNVFPSGLAEWINRSDFDVVNLHWLGAEMLSVEEIGRLAKPVCWTMHDMWPFCGSEHYDDMRHPGRYRQPYAGSNRSPEDSGPDLDAWTWRRKHRAWARQKFQLIAPSNWIRDAAEGSALLGGHPCTVIPNCVDTECFRPEQQAAARQALGLRMDRKYVLFGAATGGGDPRKGFAQLVRALEALVQRHGIRDAELLAFGPPSLGEALPLPLVNVGTISDDRRLALLYSAADVFAAPALQDNLPNTVVEALACGTPCVAFAVGGMPDLVMPQVTGWLAQPFCTEDFAHGLAYVLRSPALRANCRTQAVSRFHMHAAARSYGALYESVVQRR